MTSSIRLYEPLSDVISAFVLNAGHPKLALSLQALALHLGVHLARPPGVHQFIFTFGLKEVATDGPIPFLGLPFDATRGDRRDVRRVARIIEKHLGRWYDATLLRDVFASFFDADCQTTWRSDIAAHSSTSARVTLTLNSSSAIGELFVDRAEPHLLFRANPAPRCWLALLGSLKVAVCPLSIRRPHRHRRRTRLDGPGQGRPPVRGVPCERTAGHHAAMGADQAQTARPTAYRAV